MPITASWDKLTSKAKQAVQAAGHLAEWPRATENFERARKQVMNALRAHFKPEFLGSSGQLQADFALGHQALHLLQSQVAA